MLLQATNLCRDGEKAHETIMTHLKIKGLETLLAKKDRTKGKEFQSSPPGELQ